MPPIEGQDRRAAVACRSRVRRTPNGAARPQTKEKSPRGHARVTPDDGKPPPLPQMPYAVNG